ncbi:hypothetical protein pb186bvf_001253 [Paramecium bursaria]
MYCISRAKGLQVRDCNSFTKFKTRQKSRENEPLGPFKSQQNVKKLAQRLTMYQEGRPKTKSVMQSQQIVPCITENKKSKKNLIDKEKNIQDKKRQHSIKNRTKKTHSLSYYHYDSQTNEDDMQNGTFKAVDSEPKFINVVKSQELLEGKKLYSEGQTNEAQKIFTDVLQSTNNPEARYLIALCDLSKQDYQDAINQLQQLIQQQPLFKRNAYILLAIALKKVNNHTQALNTLTLAIKQFNKYFDAYIYRGKLYLKAQQWEKALKDFQSAIEISQNRSIAYVGAAEAQKALNMVQASIESYNKAVECEDGQQKTALLKRSLLFIELKEYQKAMDDINILVELSPQDSSALYLRGFVQAKQNQIQDAILSYEQAIKFNNSKKAVTKSLYEIAKLKIEQRDFYGAFYQLTRAEFLDVDIKVIERFRIFTDGVTFLMKRKFEEGIVNLTNLISKNLVNDFLKPLVYQYRAYGLICVGQHQKALQDLQVVNQLEKASQYNKLICEGICSAMSNLFEQSNQFFVKAQKLFPNKMEPLFYKATTIIRLYNYLIPKDDLEKRNKLLSDACRYMEKAAELNEQSNLLFYRGIVLFALQKYDDSLMDMDKAIEKSEDNIARHFYVRGILQACRKAYKPALNDFNVTISLDDKFSEAYLNRAKLLYIYGDKNSSYMDIINQKQMTLDAYISAGNMFFIIGAYDDAIKSFSQVLITEKNTTILYQRARCYLVLKELNDSMADLQKIYELTNDMASFIDYNVLQTLKITSLKHDHETFKQALDLINQLIKKDVEGRIFKKSDIIFYKGVYQFYLNDYEGAQNQIRKSYDMKEDQQNKFTSRLDDSDQFVMESYVSSQQLNKLETKHRYLEEFEFHDRTYNLYEYLFNMSILDLLQGKKEQAIDQLKLLGENIKHPEIEEALQILLQILFDDSLDTPKMEQFDEIKEFSIFPQHNRLCSIYKFVPIQLKKYSLETRLSFCLPQVDVPSMLFQFDEKLLESINPTIVENKPEAPWIRRTMEGVIFTENVQNFDDLDLQSTQRPKQQTEEDINNQIDYSIIEQDTIVEQLEAKVDKQVMKEQLMLDSKIAEKLNSILNKKK